jgi:hypothetical protein
MGLSVKVREYVRVPPASEIWIQKSAADELYELIKHLPEDTALGRWRDSWLHRAITEMKDKETTYLPLTDKF